MSQVLRFFKPYGVICQFTPSGDKATLKDHIPIPDVYPIGRLDHDSEGLLLLTDDGALSHRLTDPQYEHPKTYWAQVEGVPDEAALQRLRRGDLLIQGYRPKPAKARLLFAEPDLPPRPVPIRFRQSIPTSWIELILTEGKNRQIRRMTAAVGLPTLRLVRIAIGQINLSGLQPGEFDYLKANEIKQLTSNH